MFVGGTMFDEMDVGPKAIDNSLPSIDTIRFKAKVPYMLTGSAILAIVAVILIKNRKKIFREL